MSRISDNNSSHLSGDMNYYDILSIKKNANQIEIRRAYEILTNKYHPNKNKKMSNNRIFLDINNAYQVLSDPDLRKKYDYCLECGNKFKHNFRDPYDIYDEFNKIKSHVRKKFDGKLNEILCKIKPNKPPITKPENLIIETQLILIDGQPFQKMIEQDFNGVKYITYIHPSGLKQRVMDDHFLFQLIDSTL